MIYISLGTDAANCLLARGLVEWGVCFIQLYHSGGGTTQQLTVKVLWPRGLDY